MRKVSTFLALLGAALTIAMVVHAVRWGQIQLDRSHQDYVRWQMSWASRR